MNSFIHGKLAGEAISNGIAASLSAVEKANGKEIALRDTEPAILDNLKQTSVVTSAEASCAIEGISISADRADAILNKGEAPGTRDERQIFNYKRALEKIFETPRGDLALDRDTILGFHALVMAGEPGAGKIKDENNAIHDVEAGKKRLRFTPVNKDEAGEYLAQLCVEYAATISEKSVPDLLAISAFALDFTCIHPFRDGNGRLSRLLTTACLLNQGYELPRYISLDTIIEEKKDFYYQALKSSSEGWHTGRHSVMPFFSFMLETLVQGYAELEIAVKLGCDVDKPRNLAKSVTVE